MKLKLFGLPRSCTNVLAWLVTENLNAVVLHNAGAWKHGAPKRIPGMDGYLCTTKDPYAWIDSMMRYRPAPFEDLVAAWGIGHSRLVRFCDQEEAAHLVRYEDILASPRAVLDRIAMRFDLNMPPAKIETMPHRMGRGGDDGLLIEREPFDPAHYSEMRYMERFGPRDLAAIRTLLDPAVMRRLRYVAM